MDSLGMDMIKGFGYLLIPGFLALFLLVVSCHRPVQQERTKRDRRRISRETRNL